jgi:hypothetical protein
MAEAAITGFVARLVTDHELLINIGSEQGVEAGQVFEVLDSRTQDVDDPFTGQNLGSIRRVKARIVIVEVAETLSLARALGRKVSLTQTARIISGTAAVPVGRRLTSDVWVDGVTVKDPVVFTGEYHVRS